MFGRFRALPFRRKLVPAGIALLGLLVLVGLGTFAYQTINESVLGNTCVTKQFKRGSSGTCVKHIQTLVNSSAVTKLTVDSSFGPATETGVKTFQKVRKLKIDGIVGPETWSSLCTVGGGEAAKKAAGCPAHTYTKTTTPAPPKATTPATPKATTPAPVSSTKQCVASQYRRGNTGTCVGYIQQLLNSSQAAKVAVDKSYGPATESGIRNFQKLRKLKIDGIVGPETWSHLCGVGGAAAAKQSAGCSTIKTYSAPSPNTTPPAPKQSAPAPTNTSSGWVRPTTGTFTSGFGQRNGRLHDGVDIANKRGTPVVAASAGTVSRAGWSDSCGNVIQITHAGGIVTKYCHLNAFRVSNGTKVSAGTRIGDMGNTGISSGPHLHFAVFQNGTPINPVGFMSNKGIRL